MFAVWIVCFFSWTFDTPQWFGTVWVAGSVIFFSGWLLFMWNIWHNVRVPREKRALWTAVLVFAGPYAMPFYFWHYLR